MNLTGKRILAVMLSALIAIICTVIAIFIRIGVENERNEAYNDAITEIESKKGEYSENSIILSSTSEARAKSIAKKIGAELRISANGKFAVLTLPDGVTVEDIYNDKDNIKYISEMSLDYKVRTAALTQNRYTARPEYDITDTEYSNQTYLDYLNLRNVWNNYKGKDKTIAVIDTGIDTDHPEFEGKISNLSYNASTGKVLKDSLLADGSYDKSVIEDTVGHGTMVSGVISAQMNGEGIVGIAPDATLLVIKAEANENGVYERSSDLVFALYYAIECGADVINMSFGSYALSNIYADALALAEMKDIIVVASAGNDSSPSAHWPSADGRVIGVGALEDGGWGLASYSNYGDNTNVVAPGTVYTTVIGGGYEKVNGTSFASPIVAGAMTLLKNRNAGADAEYYRALLYASSSDLGDVGKDFKFGYGALDVAALINEQRVTVTYNMMTDELDDIEETVIAQHAIQHLPTPERLYAVFDGWYYDPYYTHEYQQGVDIISSGITLYAKWCGEEDGVPFTYEQLSDGTLKITSYMGRRRYISIPEYINGKRVAAIGNNAFSAETELRSISLPSGVKSIGDNAFSTCTSLKEIKIPASVISIGDRAFAECVRLSNISFESGSRLESIGDFAFASCSSLTYLELPEKLKEVNGTAFVGTIELISIDVNYKNASFASAGGALYNKPQSVLIAYPAGKSGSFEAMDKTLTIGRYAFSRTLVSSVSLGKVEYIEENAFSFSNLTSIVLPKTLKSLGDNAFYCSEYLKEVTINSAIKKIPSGAFEFTALKSIAIPESVTEIEAKAFRSTEISSIDFGKNSKLRSIGSYAFDGTNISKLTLPQSINTIGSYAFAGTELLAKIDFGQNSSLGAIGSYAFSGTSSLSEITLPQGLRQIGAFAFSSSGIKGALTLPVGITDIGDAAFSFCSQLESISISKENKYFSTVNGILFDKSCQVILAYPAAHVGQSYTMPKSVLVVSPYAFAGASEIAAISLSNVIELADYSLSCLENLTNIYIPTSLAKIGAFAFSSCTRLSSIKFAPDAQIRVFSANAFSNCAITEFTVPNYIERIESGAFSRLGNLRTVYFEEGCRVSAIEPNTFYGCHYLSKIEFGANCALRELKSHALDGLTNLSHINLDATRLESIGDFSMRFCDFRNTVALPSTLKSIGRYVFYYSRYLKEITIPASVEHIGSYAFLGVNDVAVYFESDVLPEKLDEDWDRGIASYSVGVREAVRDENFKYALSNDGAVTILEYFGSEKHLDLTALTLGGSNIINTIGGGAFEKSEIESIILPETLITIQNNAFRSSNLTGIRIPKSVKFIGKEAFAGTKIENLVFAAESELKTIEQSAFENTSMLSGVIIPKSVTEIGRYAFRKSGIASLVFEDGITITEISEETFAGTNIKSVDIPDTVTKICDGAFRETKSLERISYGSGEIAFGSNAFYMSGLTELYIGKNVILIEEFALTALSRLENFEVDSENPYYKSVDGVLYTKDGRKIISAPAGFSGQFAVPSGVEEIGFGAFERSCIDSISFPENTNILSIGYRAFFGASNLKTVTIPDSVVAIDYYAFAYCSSLESVKFGDASRLRGVYEGAFYDCRALYDIILPDSVSEISDFAFYACRNLTKIPVSDTSALLGIYSYAFAYTGITELKLHPTVVDLGDYAFLGADIVTAEISNEREKELYLGIGVFSDNRNLAELTLPFIGEYLDDEIHTWFGYIFGAGAYTANPTYVPESLKVITLNGSQSFLGKHAFAGLTKIEYLNLNDGITRIDEYAFDQVTAKYELTAENIGKISSYGNGYSGVLVIPEGTTEILFEEFRGFTNITEVIIPSSVRAIRYAAFSDCTSLKKVTILDGVSKIENYAFDFCTSLESIEIPDSVTAIGSGVFRNCEKLKSIVLSSSVTVIEEETFFYCVSLQSVILPESLISIENKAFEECNNLKSLDLPNTLTSIGEYAFSGCIAIQSFVIPQKVSEIKAGTFANCAKLNEITIPQSVEQIGEGAFWYCVSLKKVINHSDIQINFHDYYNDCVDIFSQPNGYIGCYVDMIVDKDGTERHRSGIITTADNLRFKNQNGVYTLTEYLGNEKTVTLPESINGEKYTIYKMRGVENVIIPEGFDGITEAAFMDCKTLKSIVIPGSVKAIEDGAFRGCTNLASVTLSEGLEKIGESAFSECGLSSGALPSTVKEIGRWAFSYCEKLIEIDLPDGIKEIKDYIFAECFSLVRVGIPDSVESIQRHSFYYCTALLSVDLPRNLSYLSGEAFYGTSVTVKNFPDNENYKDIDGIVYKLDYAGVPVEIAFASKSIESVIIPKGIYVNEYAFKDCTKLKSVKFESGYDQTSLGEGAFSGCTALREIELPDSITYIGYGVFSGCTSLERVKFPSNLNYMGGSGLSGCTALKSFDFDTALDYLPASTFKGCTALESVTLGGNIKTVGYEAFAECSSIKEINWSSSIDTIESRAFYKSGIVKIVIPDSVTYIGEEVFKQTDKLKELILPAGLKNIPNGLCTLSSIESVFIPESVETVGGGAFSYCHNLKTPIVLKNAVCIGENAFAECFNIPSVEFSDKLTSIGHRAFYSCNSITELTLPSSLENMGVCVFMSCEQLLSVTVPSTLTAINDHAFFNCRRLCTVVNNSDLVFDFESESNGFISMHAVVIKEKDGTVRRKTNEKGEIIEFIETADGYRFMKAGENYTLKSYHGGENTITLPLYINGSRYTLSEFYGAEHIIIPEGFTDLGYSAFANSTKIKSVVIPDSASQIGGIFANCSSLESVTIGRGTVRIYNGTFSDCTSLKEINFTDSVRWIDKGAFENTAFYKDKSNWCDGALYIGDCLVALSGDIKYLKVREDTRIVATGLFEECHYLEYLRIDTGICTSYILNGLTNIKCIEIFGEPSSYLPISSFFGRSVPETLERVVLSKGVVMNSNLLMGLKNITVFVEEEKEDLGWDENFYNWNKGNRVVYGDKWIRVEFYNHNGNLVSISHQLSSQVIRVPFIYDEIGEKYCYTTVGYDIDGDGRADTMPATSTTDIFAYPVLETRIREFKVTFVDNLGNSIFEYTVPYGTLIPKPQDPIKKGYKFIGWLDYSEDIVITEDTVIKSDWNHIGGGHSFGATIITEPTCTEKGIAKRVCSVCDEYYITSILNQPTGHDYKKTTVEPSCISVGYDLYKCSCGDNYKKNYTLPLGHSFGEWKETKAPNCNEYGEVQRICGNCSKTETEPTAKAIHQYTKAVTKSPSCTEEGEITYVCSCGDKETEAIPTLSHSYKAVRDGKKQLDGMKDALNHLYYATDSEGGYYLCCSDCGHIVLNSEVALLSSTSTNSVCRHSAGEWITEPRKDCGLNELCTVSCLECLKVLDARVARQAEEHKLGNWISIVEPTCTENGKLGHFECTACHICFEEDGKTEIDSLSIHMLGHNYIHKITAPTCLGRGYTTHTCSRGDSEYKDTYVDALGHNYTQEVTAPTCTDEGYTTHTCSRGDSEYKDTYVDALGHNYTQEVTAPTCTDEGYTTHTCSRGDSEYKDTYVDALGHNYTQEVTAPTCTDEGYTTHTCSRGDSEYKDDYARALGHSYGGWYTVTEAKCETNGEERCDCIRCESYQARSVARLGHDYLHTVTAPTCADEGYTTHTCSRGDSEYKDNYVKTIEHSFGEWTVITQPTKTESGSKMKSCTECAHTINMPIPALSVSDEDSSLKSDRFSTGAIVGIVGGVSATAALGIFSLVWFVIKKKSLAELLLLFKK